MVKGIAALIVSMTALLGLIFVVLLLSTVMGGIAGWAVGMVFPYVTSTVSTIIGVQLTNFQVGAVLGFVGGFFRSAAALTKKG